MIRLDVLSKVSFEVEVSWTEQSGALKNLPRLLVNCCMHSQHVSLVKLLVALVASHNSCGCFRMLGSLVQLQVRPALQCHTTFRTWVSSVSTHVPLQVHLVLERL